MAGRTLRAGLELLDRKIIDKDGKQAGTVDDLELTIGPEGGQPYVTAILTGPGALARRLGGRLGAWVESLHARLHHAENPGPARVSFGVVKKAGNHIEVTVSKKDLDVSLFEKWTRERIISRIPGSGHAPE